MIDEGIPCARFSLRMCDLPSGNFTTVPTYNSAGWAYSGRGVCGWSNINMRNVIGSALFDKYKSFNLVMAAVTADLETGVASTTGDRINQILMSGLPWMGQGYDSKTKCVTSTTVIGQVYITPGTGIAQDANKQATIMVAPCTFAKSDMQNDLVITLYRASNGAVPTTTVDFNLQFHFNIYPVIE